jgi:hypothetical protein
MDHMEEAPREEDRAHGVALYRSKFGTGSVAGGNMSYQLGYQDQFRMDSLTFKENAEY